MATMVSPLRRACRVAADATAVVCGDSRMTYGELDALSNQLARLLKDAGCVRGDLVLEETPHGFTKNAELVRIVRSPGVFPMPDVPIIMLSSNGERWREIGRAHV